VYVHIEESSVHTLYAAFCYRALSKLTYEPSLRNSAARATYKKIDKEEKIFL
jgi:hypothetical protein